MALVLEPSIAVEAGRFTALVSPPELLVGLLLEPEVDRFASLYLYGVSSQVLGRLPRRAPRLLVRSCMTVYQLLTSLREADESIVIVEYDDGVFSALEGEDRDVIFAVGRQLRELARDAAVLLWAPRAERGFRALMGPADRVVWYYEEWPARQAGSARRRGRDMQATLDGVG